MFGNKTSFYEVFADESKEDPVDSLQVIGYGLCIPAMIPLVQTFWYLSQRLWLPAIFITAMMIMTYYLQVEVFSFNDPSSGILRVGVMVFSGVLANDWLADGLRRRGYTFQGLVMAQSPDEAKLLAVKKFFYDQENKSLNKETENKETEMDDPALGNFI